MVVRTKRRRIREGTEAERRVMIMMAIEEGESPAGAGRGAEVEREASEALLIHVVQRIEQLRTEQLRNT